MTAADLKLPRLMAVAFKVGGIGAVQKLSDVFGGKLAHIPLKENCSDRHILVQTAGRAVANALCDAYGGGSVEFPRAQKVLRLYLAAGLVENGASNNAIVDALDVSWREARRLRKRLKGRDALARALAELRPPSTKESRQTDLEHWLKTAPSPAKR